MMSVTRYGRKMRKTPKNERARAKDRAWQWFSKWVRLRDCLLTMRDMEFGKCVTCGRVVHGGEADAGHFVAGRRDAYLLDPRGCHLQCKRCNQHMDGYFVEYEEVLMRRYGPAVVAELKELRHNPLKKSAEDWRELAELFRIKYNNLKETGHVPMEDRYDV